MYDPQTSGGLLISLAPGQAEDLLAQLQQIGLRAAIIGAVLDPQKAGTRAGEIRLV